jgi:hypothetical protein
VCYLAPVIPTCGRLPQLVIQKSSTIILTISYTETSVNKAINEASLLGIYKLSHSWVIVKTTVTTNGLKYVLKGFLIQVSGVKERKPHFHCPHTSWTAVILINHPFCDGGG